MLAFRRAVEAHEFQRIGELFAEDIVFHSPIAFKPYHGREMVVKIVNIASTIFEDFAYQREIGQETDDAAKPGRMGWRQRRTAPRRSAADERRAAAEIPRNSGHPRSP